MPTNLMTVFKEVLALAKKASDRELYEKIVDFQAQVVELSGRNLELEKENREQREALAVQKVMTFRAPYYFQEGDDVPFCPRCWEADRKAIHLSEETIRNPSGGIGLRRSHFCWACKTSLVIRKN